MSSIGITKSLHTMDHSHDPAQLIKNAVGDISNVEITGVQVLVGTYIRPEKTASGIILTEKFRDEDLYQGKVGLVLKVAPGAFVDGPNDHFNGFKLQEGDWVFYRVGDGFSLSVNGHHCRIVEDIHIRGRVKSPDTVL